jgi:hypothetical protein|tara:strand:+ start:418 stop:546 length:129 start_codon:yes stop_codon:yes gene_type:complete
MNVAEIIKAIKMLSKADKLMVKMWLEGHYDNLEKLMELMESE